jgi:anhydro-N-acetylmuramic acid kinase
MLVVGLMSGTSMDGITAALAEIRDRGPSGEDVHVQLVAYETVPFSKELRQRLMALAESGTVPELCSMNFYLGELCAEAALRVIERAGLSPDDVELIGSHGQTVYHLPRGLEALGDFSRPSTLQIGEIDVIAERTGITTVGDFRPKDMAAGGEGAPLIPYLDWQLFHSDERHRVLLNLGGIANVTYLPAGASLDDVQAFDVGPGNMLIDGAVRALTRQKLLYDPEGQLAAQGRVCEGLLQTLLRHPFIHQAPPKTTGREDFGERFLAQVLDEARKLELSMYDTLATVTAFTAEAVAVNCQTFLGPIDELIVSGGGAHNRTLLRLLSEKLPNVPITTTDAYGIPVEAKEALGFALLAYQALHRRPNNVPRATGAKHPVIIGKISWGRSAKRDAP